MERKPGLLDYNGPVMQASQHAVRLMAVNMLFLLGCLPVVTAGASLLALSRASLRHWEEGPHTPVCATFLTAFWEKLGQGALLSLALLAAGGIFYLDFSWLLAEGSPVSYMLLGAMTGVLLLLVLLVLYLPPVLSKSGCSLRQGFRTAACCGILHWRRTLPMAAVICGSALLLLLLPQLCLLALPLLLLFGASLPAYLCSALLGPALETLEG